MNHMQNNVTPEEQSTQRRGLHVVESLKKTVKRTRRRVERDPLISIADEVPREALRTRSLKKTAENLVLRESEVCFQLALHAIDLVRATRDGFGRPALRKPALSEVTVRDAQRFRVVDGAAA